MILKMVFLKYEKIPRTKGIKQWLCLFLIVYYVEMGSNPLEWLMSMAQGCVNYIF